MKSLSLLVLLAAVTNGYAELPDKKDLPRGLASFERPVRLEAPPSEPPQGAVRSLAEWEEAEAVMTLWPNPSLISELAARGRVKLITDDSRGQGWWSNWLATNNIPSENISYFFAKTDSIWVRDYGPWFVLDGAGKFGIVDTTYNRPRPNDDKVPQVLAKVLNLPIYQAGLVHTGGNYYNDGQESAFSSTLVYSENPSLTKAKVNERMETYLGIKRYTTSKLGQKITIEHIDTFGKLVSPDTWVFSDFPEGSRFKKDSDAYVALLKNMTSAYGTPYKIYRLKMRLREGRRSLNRAENYRAYINSFISNKALYFPSYGDEIDDEVKAIYQEALPGYEIVGVDNGNTSWGDSVHCRNRNLLKEQTLFLFPSMEAGRLILDAVPSPGGTLVEEPVVLIEKNGRTTEVQKLERLGAGRFQYSFSGKSGDKFSFVISARDSNGVEKMSPIGAPAMKMEYQVP